MEERTFTISGKKVTLTRHAIEEAVQNVAPGPINKYSVSISGIRYPIKQVVSLVSGQPPAAFIATDAYRILTRLGFEVQSETGTHCANVVCDLHKTDMRFVQVRHGMGIITKVLDGFACSMKGCVRFFGTEGYSDLTKKSEFTNIRTEPSCSNQHEAQPMYIQRTPDCLRWVCPICEAVKPFSKEYMRYTLTLHEYAWPRDGPALRGGEVIGYQVGGMPDGKSARIANYGAPNRNDWRILRINADNTQGDWTGEYQSAEAALAVLQKDFD